MAFNGLLWPPMPAERQKCLTFKLKNSWHCCMCCNPANGRVDFEEWSAYKIQLHGIEKKNRCWKQKTVVASDTVSPVSDLSISIKDFVREKKICNRKKERAARAIFFMKLNTKPLKFKCGLADGGGVPGCQGCGLVDPCKAWVPPPSSIIKESSQQKWDSTAGNFLFGKREGRG
jgi:hypothetical protein